MSEFVVKTLAEHPELQEPVDQLAQYWEAFMHHDVVADRHFAKIYEWFAEYQVAILDAKGQVVARALSAPIIWDGDDASLPDTGWDWVLNNSVETCQSGKTPNAVTAIEISIVPELRGRGLSRVALYAMKENARQLGFERLIAPVRPSLKSRYPITPIDRYIQWTQKNSDAPFDPWLRVHWRDGARLVRAAKRSMEIIGTVDDWEAWTGLHFPESGDYVVAGALVPVTIDFEANQGTYIEPNVWMVHPIT